MGLLEKQLRIQNKRFGKAIQLGGEDAHMALKMELSYNTAHQNKKENNKDYNRKPNAHTF